MLTVYASFSQHFLRMNNFWNRNASLMKKSNASNVWSGLKKLSTILIFKLRMYLALVRCWFFLEILKHAILMDRHIIRLGPSKRTLKYNSVTIQKDNRGSLPFYSLRRSSNWIAVSVRPQKGVKLPSYMVKCVFQGSDSEVLLEDDHHFT